MFRFAYFTPAICRTIILNNQKAFMPYVRQKTKKDCFKKYEYVYDEYYDCFICPNYEVLNYSTTARNGYKVYKSNPEKSKNFQKVITRHVWEEDKEETNENRYTQEWKKINYSAKGTFKLNLLDRDDIIKVGINTYAQDSNYFEYDNKNMIDKIYNIFNGLETKVVSKTYNPENPDEMYSIKFICDPMKLIYSDKVREDTIIEVYKKDGKYYAEQRYNGIYEITEEDFNAIKSYIK